MVEAKRNWDFALVFKAIDFATGGILVVSDAALGNVNQEGTTEVPTIDKVFSQSCYAVVLADESLMRGTKGKFNVLDFRSHRIPRVCRSSYAAETLGAEEGLDAGELCRGFVAELRNIQVGHRQGYVDVCRVPMVGVADAKDVFDRFTQDTGFAEEPSLFLGWHQADAAETKYWIPLDVHS